MDENAQRNLDPPPLSPQAEPVLLVGETGTGKTTLLSRVAAMTRSRLVAFNMSQQTDSSDLLGGFKPVDVRDALLPLLPPFLTLIRKTYTKSVKATQGVIASICNPQGSPPADISHLVDSQGAPVCLLTPPSFSLPCLRPASPLLSLYRGNNEDFLSRCTKLAERRKWPQLLQAFKTGLSKVEDAACIGISTAAAAASVPGPDSVDEPLQAVSPQPPREEESAAATVSTGGKKGKKSGGGRGRASLASPVQEAALEAAASPAEEQPVKRRKIELTEHLRYVAGKRH